VTEPLSLYLHIPFCDHRCAYCDFNAYAGLEGLMPAYTDALMAEIHVWGEILGSPPRPPAPSPTRGEGVTRIRTSAVVREPLSPRPPRGSKRDTHAALGTRHPALVPTVFFGGGTPSLLPLPMLERVIGAVRECFAVAPDAEWSLEANPGTVDEAYFRGLRALGVNRVSLGVQSFDDEELRRLDRIHDAAAAEAAYHGARAAGFANVSLDLIFGLEGQSLAGWQRNVARALALGPEHLSLYALTIEEGTPLAHRVAKGLAPEPDADLQADMYELAQEQLAAAGYEQYEISNWSKPGFACRHNLVYWRDGEWLGMGAGAHSHLAGMRFAVMNSPAGYIRRVRPNPPAPFPKGKGVIDRSHTQARAGCGSPPLAGEGSGERSVGEGPGGEGQIPALPWIASVERSSPATAMADAAIMALRLSEGLSLTAFRERFGVSFESVYGDVAGDLAGLGLLERADGRVCIPARARLLANEVFARLMPVPGATPRSIQAGH
jgi:oxygen-independent coproporphyrinogen-3 oxidase